MCGISIASGGGGTLWEGRYKSCLVADADCLLEFYRYVERKPVRAGMVDDPAEHRWSSYQTNARGVASRLANYRGLFSAHFESDLANEIRQVTERGLVLGDPRFVDEMERLTTRRLRPARGGRPPKENGGEAVGGNLF